MWLKGERIRFKQKVSVVKLEALCSEGGGKSELTISEDPTLYLYQIEEKGVGCEDVTLEQDSVKQTDLGGGE